MRYRRRNWIVGVHHKMFVFVKQLDHYVSKGLWARSICIFFWISNWKAKHKSVSSPELLKDTSYLCTVLLILWNSTQTTFFIVDSKFKNLFYDLESVILQTIPATLENGVGFYCCTATPTEDYFKKYFFPRYPKTNRNLYFHCISNINCRLFTWTISNIMRYTIIVDSHHYDVLDLSVKKTFFRL